ncbi:MAG: DUF4240 domain-containing protein [Bacteroidota bacterium]
MQATIRISVNQLSEHFLQEMKEKYAGAELEISINREQREVEISEDFFWELIALLDWEQEENKQITEPLIDRLSQLGSNEIYGFQDILSEKLYQLDQEVFASSTVKNIDDLSADGFLYDRLCVVANGRAFYEEVLAHPSQMPKNLSFEPLLYVAAKAYEKKTGKEFSYFPMFNYETYSNKEGWLS